MKKILIIFMVIMLFITLIGCGKKNDNDSSNNLVDNNEISDTLNNKVDSNHQIDDNSQLIENINNQNNVENNQSQIENDSNSVIDNSSQNQDVNNNNTNLVVEEVNDEGVTEEFEIQISDNEGIGGL